MNEVRKQRTLPLAWLKKITWPEDQTDIKRAFGSAESVVWHAIYEWHPRRASGG
tara:strand:- start:284 stop:445 length:162 start_codon:yes stop_codon:yes gene_type:complete